MILTVILCQNDAALLAVGGLLGEVRVLGESYKVIH